MSYFVSHIGVILIAAAFVALCAVGWWYLDQKNAMLIRQRAEARKAAAAAQAKKEKQSDKEQ